ncbi:MAG: ankyrin repeat domain-containing protein [Planctomycetota bacterium]|jgi:hypothetical protein
MPRSLPQHPSLENLKKQAKSLHKAHRNGETSCCQVFRQLNRFAEAGDPEILAADVSLSDVQFALAMAYGFESWDKLKAHVGGLTEGASATAAEAAGTATLNGQEYRFEWLAPQQLFGVEVMVDGEEHYDEACEALWGRRRRTDPPSPYAGHVWPLYNLQEDTGPLTPPEGDRYGAMWFELGRGLAGKVDRFALLAFADGGLAGTIRFFPKTLTIQHWGGWGERNHRREWTDDILWIGCAYVDLAGIADGLDLELTRRVVAMAREDGFAKVQATGWGELPVYAMWGQAFRASVFRAAGFTPIVATKGCPDALDHMLNGCHGEEDRARARAEIQTGPALDTAHQCAVLELLLSDDASAGTAPVDSGSGDVLDETVLHWAARHGQTETAEWLLARGASVNVRSSDGLTPLQLAESAEVQDILRRHGAEG